MRIPRLIKRPDEGFAVGLKYVTPDLEEGEELQSADVAISPVETGGLEKYGNVVIEPDTVSQYIKGGVNGHEYYVLFTVITTGGQKYQDAVYVMVRSITT